MTIAICAPPTRTKVQLRVGYSIEDRITAAVERRPFRHWMALL
jgi:hypothetical protein